jgi:hypothetical protein
LPSFAVMRGDMIALSTFTLSHTGQATSLRLRC